MYAKPSRGFQFAINNWRYSFIAYKDVLKKQKGMKLLREVNTENVELLRDLGKVTIYEVADDNNSSGSSGDT